MEEKIIEAIQYDTPDLLLSLLPKDQILNYCFTNNIQTDATILLNCPPLHCVAAYFGSIKCLQFLFDHGDRFKTVDQSSKTIIDFSLAGGHQDTFKFLIDHGYDSNHLLETGINSDNASIFKYLIESGKKLNTNTLLFQAVKSGRIEIVKYLSPIVEDINAFDEEGNTFLHIAVENSQIEIMKFLFSTENTKIKIDTNPTNPKTGESLLHVASKNDNKDIISLILSVHNCNETVWDFMTLDFLAPENDVRKRKGKGTKNPPKFLDLNQKDKNGDTPLIVASRDGGFSIVQFLLTLDSEPQIDLNLTNKEGDNALITAVKGNRIDVVRYLVENDQIQLNHLNSSGFSALHIACQNDYVEIASLLMYSDGIDVNVKSEINGLTPLHVTVMKNNSQREVIFNDLLNSCNIDTKIKNDENMTPFFLAAKEGNKEFFIKLMNLPGSSILDVDINGQTPLHSAVRFNHLEICKLIIEKSLCNEKNGSNEIIDINQRDNDGWTPLYYAARNGHEDIVLLLLSLKGIDVNKEDNRQKTPLYFTMNQNVRAILQNHGAI